MSEHEQWEELAAGYALDALEPDESELFTAHLKSCARCEGVLAEHAFVAAQLGTIVDVDAEAPAWSGMRSRIVGTAAPAAVTSLDEVRARRRAPRLLSAAAAAVLVAGGGAVWLASSGSSPDPQQVALSACASQAGCHVVKLQDKATLVVSDGSVRLLSSSLRSPGAGNVYVLWQLPRGGEMALVGALRSATPGTVGESHPLVLPYEQTSAFGLSVEPATAIPANPSAVVALGTT